MEALSRACACVVLLSAATVACKPPANGMSDAQETPQTFATPEEAVRKAKADFLEVLRSGRDIALGVEASILERAQPGPLVPRKDLDFGRLLAADSTVPFEALVAGERNTVVPFLADGAVVTIVEIVEGADGWRVVGLAGRDIAQALDIVHRVVGDSVPHQVTLYEVPNLQTRVYGVKRGDAEVLHTDYEGRFSLREGVSAAVLVPVLKAGAIEFQRVYGDSLKRGPLLR